MVAVLTALAAVLATAATGLLTTSTVHAAPAQDAPSCAVSYRVVAQWAGSFVAQVAVTNLGDPVRSWELAWSAASGQRVEHAFNAVVRQRGAAVTLRSTRYSGSVQTGRTAVAMISGRAHRTAPAPGGFTFNGTACTVAGVPTPAPSPTSPAPAPDPTPPVVPDPMPVPDPEPTSSPSSAPQPTDPPTAPAWGADLPPADATVSHAYEALRTASSSGYAPRSGECAVDVHARYWTYGPDGKVYPTWHPPRDPSGCTFGHEHGDDPRTSTLFETTGWPAFAYTNEVLAHSTDTHTHRHEDHVGHKVLAADDVAVIQGDNGISLDAPQGATVATCDVLLKFHQGTHSADAFTNNLHELLFASSCEQDGRTVEARYSALIPLGRPGGFGSTDCPGPLGRGFTQVGSASPAGSPSDTRSLGRLLTDRACVDAIIDGADFDSFDLHEFWFADVRLSAGDVSFQLAPLFYVLNPSRYHDASAPGRLGRTVDTCYEGVPGFYCDSVRRTTERTGRQVAWDEVASPFKGTLREYRPGTFSLRTSGPTTVYTDALGGNASTTPFAGSIAQHFSGSTSSSMYVRGATRDWAGSPSDGVHAPN